MVSPTAIQTKCTLQHQGFVLHFQMKINKLIKHIKDGHGGVVLSRIILKSGIKISSIVIRDDRCLKTIFSGWMLLSTCWMILLSVSSQINQVIFVQIKSAAVGFW